MMNAHSLWIILVVAAVTFLTRAAPFVLFSGSGKTPGWVDYLGKVLPPAVMAMLVVYGVGGSATFFQYPYGLPELIAVVCVAALHKLWHNMLLSILGGTGIYMLLVQLVFQI